jgi:hypothetical protein
MALDAELVAKQLVDDTGGAMTAEQTTNPDPSTGLAPLEAVPLGAIKPAAVLVRANGIDDLWVDDLTHCAADWPPLLITDDGTRIDGHHRHAAALALG